MKHGSAICGPLILLIFNGGNAEMAKDYNNEGMMALATAIIESAADDYIDGLLTNNGVPCGSDLRAMDFNSALTFFKSDWFINMYPGKVDPDAFIRKLNSDGVYMRCIRTYATNLWTINNSKSKSKREIAEFNNERFRIFFESTWWKDNVGMSKEETIENATTLYKERVACKKIYGKFE